MSLLDTRLYLDRGDFSLDVAFTVPARGITALFGTSGSGKTTVLRCLAGLERAAGYLRLGGDAWQDDERKLFLPPHQRPLGYVFQDARLFPHLNVLENLTFGRRRLPKGQQGPVEPIVALLDIGHLLHRFPIQLSGGEQQRVAIGRALLTNPALLLMDEPLSGLDHQRKAEILPYLDQLHHELSIPVVYVSHDVDEVRRLADHLVLIERGRVVASDRAHALLGRIAPLGDQDAIRWTGVVAGHDPENGTTLLDVEGGQLQLKRLALSMGQKVVISIAAEDVILARDKPTHLTVPTVLQAVITEVKEQQPQDVRVYLTVGRQALCASITRQAWLHLGLEQDMTVYVLLPRITVESI